MKPLPSNPYFFLMGAFFGITLVISNLVECKPFQIGNILLTGGFIIFPLSCVLNDCITEVWGYQNARFIILSAFAFNALAVLFFNGIAYLPSASFWEEEDKFNYIFRSATRTTLASFIAFFIGALLNAYLMNRMKNRMKSKFFGLRSLLSTFIGECVDSLIFFPIAFLGAFPLRILFKIMITQAVLKTVYELILLPISSIVVRKLKKGNHSNLYETNEQ